ncbi:MAG: hypothetical protein ACTTJ7_02550 [Treponema sp.]
MQNNNNGLIVFPFLSLFLRGFYAVIAFCIAAASLFFYLEEHKIPFVGILIVLVSIIVIFSKDQWEFDCSAQCAAFNVGFAGWGYCRTYPFSAIARAETEQFTRGFFVKTTVTKCVLVLHTGEKKVIALFVPQRHPKLQKQWEVLAGHFNAAAPEQL